MTILIAAIAGAALLILSTCNVQDPCYIILDGGACDQTEPDGGDTDHKKKGGGNGNGGNGNGGGSSSGGNPGNDKSVGKAGEKEDKGGFGAPPGGTGTHGRGDKDGQGSPGHSGDR